MKMKNQFRVSGLKDKVQKMKGKRMLIPFRQRLTIQKILMLILSLLTTTPGVSLVRHPSWPLTPRRPHLWLGVDGIKTLEE